MKTLGPQLLAQLDRIETLRLALLEPERDTDALHQLRIALRGWRTLLPLMLGKSADEKALLAAWHRIAALTGPARDAEVLLGSLPASHPARERLASEVSAHYDAIETALKSVDWPVLVAASRGWITLRQAQTKPGKLVQRIARKKQQLSRQIGQSDDNWHRLRIRVKKLRYLLELTGEKQHPALKRLRKAQKALGQLHDLEVACAHQLGNDTQRPALLAKAARRHQRLSQRLSH
ncbi:CHAD domain-containing protein [Chitinibacteraceae bacterium HSL-7]